MKVENNILNILLNSFLLLSVNANSMYLYIAKKDAVNRKGGTRWFKPTIFNTMNFQLEPIKKNFNYQSNSMFLRTSFRSLYPTNTWNM